jgi:hypothetical protein
MALRVHPLAAFREGATQQRVHRLRRQARLPLKPWPLRAARFDGTSQEVFAG